MARRKSWQPAAGKGVRDNRLFTLEVFIISGPITEHFAKRNPVISRTIQIRGNQSLARLHQAIFDAFDREDEHMYEFQIGGRGPMDPAARRFVLPTPMGDPFDDQEPAGTVTGTRIGSLGLNVHDAIGYWFDFGDDWWHQINVVSIEDGAGEGKYPRVVKRVGKSPPQYADSDS